MPKPETERIMI